MHTLSLRAGGSDHPGPAVAYPAEPQSPDHPPVAAGGCRTRILLARPPRIWVGRSLSSTMMIPNFEEFDSPKPVSNVGCSPSISVQMEHLAPNQEIRERFSSHSVVEDCVNKFAPISICCSETCRGKWMTAIHAGPDPDSLQPFLKYPFSLCNQVSENWAGQSVAINWLQLPVKTSII